MSVSSLAFDGKTVFGRDLPALPQTDTLEGIPAQMQIDHLQDSPSMRSGQDAPSAPEAGAESLPTTP